jgi:hypothetical protein
MQPPACWTALRQKHKWRGGELCSLETGLPGTGSSEVFQDWDHQAVTEKVLPGVSATVGVVKAVMLLLKTSKGRR